MPGRPLTVTAAPMIGSLSSAEITTPDANFFDCAHAGNRLQSKHKHNKLNTLFI
jgi:hypothetical protein